MASTFTSMQGVMQQEMRYEQQRALQRRYEEEMRLSREGLFDYANGFNAGYQSPLQQTEAPAPKPKQNKILLLLEDV